MLELILKRTHTDVVNGTSGTLAVKGQFPFCVTLEKPDLNNAPQKSCIQPGRYAIKLTLSPHFNKILPELQNVPNRTHIRMHTANLHTELLGCIAVGESFEDINGKPGISDSKGAFDELFKLLVANKDASFITIEKCYKEGD